MADSECSAHPINTGNPLFFYKFQLGIHRFAVKIGIFNIGILTSRVAKWQPQFHVLYRPARSRLCSTRWVERKG